MRRKTERRGGEYARKSYADMIGRVAANVRRLRDSHGWTQEQAAEHCDDMATYVFQLVEAGRTNVTATTLARIADGFAVDVRDLLDPAPAPKPRAPGRPKKVATNSLAKKARKP